MRLPDEFRNRTKRYASAVIQLYVRLPKKRKEVEVLGNQLLRSATSVAAHVREASRARSGAEFCPKLDGALQEADESLLWLEQLRDDCGIAGEELPAIIGESNQLIAILTTIIRKSRD